ncbi:hypothetical protein R6Q59_020936 [Mikania micrantha]
MGEFQEHQIIKETSTHLQWVFDEAKNDDEFDSDFVEEWSNDSSATLSSSELIDDATSSSSSFHDGPLYELSELMTHLPVKKGLSKYYQGKSESFGSLANFKNIEDIAKKRNKRSRWSKCKSQSQILSPKGRIVKNKKSCSSSVSRSCLVSSLGEMSSMLETGVVQKRF